LLYLKKKNPVLTMSPEEDKRTLARAIFIPLLLLILIWAVKGLEYLGEVAFDDYGIEPRKLHGLLGILFAPLLHANLNHLISNSIPLFILTLAIFYFYRSIALKILFYIWLIGGACVWIAASGNTHIGASGLVYGEAAFLFFSGIIRNNIKLLAISLLTTFLYGGMVWGIFPFVDKQISWESHLFGGCTGVILAVIYANKGPQKENVVWEEEEEEYPYWEQENLNDSEQETNNGDDLIKN
jgi:membrane associated rhomboid family serine protease